MSQLITLKDLKNEYKSMSSGDSWGDAMGCAFTLCEYLYTLDEYDVPELMKFRAGAFGVKLNEDDPWLEIFRLADVETLESFGKLLNRLINILKAQGKGY